MTDNDLRMFAFTAIGWGMARVSDWSTGSVLWLAVILVIFALSVWKRPHWFVNSR